MIQLSFNELRWLIRSRTVLFIYITCSRSFVLFLTIMWNFSSFSFNLISKKQCSFDFVLFDTSLVSHTVAILTWASAVKRLFLEWSAWPNLVVSHRFFSLPKNRSSGLSYDRVTPDQSTSEPLFSPVFMALIHILLSLRFPLLQSKLWGSPVADPVTLPGLLLDKVSFFSLYAQACILRLDQHEDKMWCTFQYQGRPVFVSLFCHYRTWVFSKPTYLSMKHL